MRRRAVPVALAAITAALLALPAGAWADADTTPPDIEFTGALFTSQVTNSASPQAEFTVSDASGLASVQCGVDGGALAGCTSPFQMSGLADGIHTVTVKAVDASPQANSNTQSFQFVVDTTKPTLDLPSQTTTTGLVGWGYSDDDGPVTSHCHVVDSGSNVVADGSCSDPYDMGSLAAGVYTLTVYVTDRAGNQSDPQSDTVTLSGSAPTASIDTHPDAISSATEPSFTFTATGGTVTCKIDGVAQACSGGAYTQATPLPDGGHYFEVDVDNGSGGAAQAFYDFVVDTTAPSVVIDGTDGAFINNAIGFSASDVSSPSITTNCSIDGDFPTGCGPTIDLTGLPEGTHTIKVYATDAAGNTGSATRTIRIDRFPPVLTLQNLQTGDSTALLTFQASDSGSAVHVNCGLDGAPLGACTTSTSYEVTGLAPGNHVLTVVATDEAGHTNTGTAAVTITGPTSSGGGTSGGGGGTTTTTTGSGAGALKLSVRLHRHGHRAPSLTLRCNERCTVRLRFTRRGKTLGTRTVKLAAGRSATITLRLSKGFGRARSLKVLLRATATDGAGHSSTRSLSVTLYRR